LRHGACRHLKVGGRSLAPVASSSRSSSHFNSNHAN
jgi:hypothetical protein